MGYSNIFNPLFTRLGATALMVGVALPAASQTLEEVVVTAQKRSQSMQDVPIALNAYDASFLQTTGVQNLGGLQQFTPGLDIESLAVTQPTYKIRGIGSGGLSIGTDPAVGIYTDGIYVGRSASSNVEFSDIERVEVLKGPQGTLFGRNAAAGAIQIITKKPVQETEGMVRVRAGNYDKFLAEGVYNTPIIEDELAGRFNVISSSRDGYIDNALQGNDLGDEDYYAGRASFLWTPQDETSLRYSFDYNRLNQDAPVAIGLNSDLSPTGTQGGEIGDVDVFGEVANDVISGEEKRKLYAHSLELDQELESTTMTFIASYRHFDANARQDEDGLGSLDYQPPVEYLYLDTNNIEHNSQFYSELRFAGETESLIWVGGLSYYHEEGKQAAEVTANVGSLVRNLTSDPANGIYATPDDMTCLILSELALGGQGYPCGTFDTETMRNEATTNSYAAFGDVTWQINDLVSLTVGARLTYDDKKFGWDNPPNSLTGNSADDVIFPVDSPESVLAKEGWYKTKGSWDNFDPRIVLNVYPTDGVMLWASYANGYTAGGFNSLQVGSEFDPEEVDNYELGVKSEFFDNTVRINASIYHYEYSDKQDIVQVDNGGQVRVFATSTGDAEGNGFESEFLWLPIENLQLALNYGYLDAQWSDREIEGYYDGCGVPRTSGNLDGEQLDGPKQRLSLMADYDLQLGDRGTILFHIDHSLTSKKELNPASAEYCQDFDTRDDDFNLTNARISWEDPDANWQVALWAENLFDTEHVVGYNAITSDLGSPYVRRNLPRMYGMEVIYNW
jgi:iron complex outermembrane receptor protein